MIGKLIDFILREQLLIIFLSVILLVGGLYAFKVLNIEAYPDPSPPTIEVIGDTQRQSDRHPRSASTSLVRGSI